MNKVVKKTLKTRPMVNGACKRRSKFFYLKLLDMGHPYMVRWFDAFDGLFCDDIINIIAYWCFYKSSFPKVELYDEMKIKGLFTHSMKYISFNEYGYHFTNESLWWCEIQTLNAYNFDKFDSKPIYFLEKVFSWDLVKCFYWCNDILKLGYSVADKDTLRTKFLMPIIVSFMLKRLIYTRHRKTKNLSDRLNGRVSRFEVDNDAFKEIWHYGKSTRRDNDLTDTKIYDAQGENGYFPRYISGGFGILDKKQLIETIDKQRKFGIIKDTSPIKSKKVKFLRWYLRTSGAYMNDYFDMKKAVNNNVCVDTINEINKRNNFIALIM